jgi:hypothetical protein
MASLVGLLAPEVASASTAKCTVFAASTDYAGSVCISVTGTKLNVSAISGSYGGNPQEVALSLKINGSVVYTTATKDVSSWGPAFPKKYDHSYKNGTTMQVCDANYIEFEGKVCSPTITIHT